MARSDEKIYAGILMKNMVYKVTALSLSSVCIVLAIALYLASQKRVEVVVIDNKGEASFTKTPSVDVYRNMALFAGEEFITSLNSYDSDLAPFAREKAFWYLSPLMRKQHAGSINDSAVVTDIIKSRASSRIGWIMKPNIVEWAYPNARLYSSFKTIIDFQNGQVVEKEHNMTVDLTFVESTKTRPSGIFVTNFKYINDGEELTNILNRVGRK